VTTISEADVEEIALNHLRNLGWDAAYGPDIERDYSQVVFEDRFHAALADLNPDLPDDALDCAFRKITQPEGPSLETRNRALHRMFVWGVEVVYRDRDSNRGKLVKVIDFDDPAANDYLAVTQFTVTERDHNQRPDIVLFVNGFPIGVIELKNPTDENATIKSAWQQLQTYKAHVPSLFTFNELLMVSDGTLGRIGSLTAGWEWFKPWRTITGQDTVDDHIPQLQVMLAGICQPDRLLLLIRDFIVFEDTGGSVAKKMAGYHQFHAARMAVRETLRATGQRVQEVREEIQGRYGTRPMSGGLPGDQRVGVVWHTQGSGKSLTMAFFAGAVVREQAMENPTIVVLTDRNDLDNQLFDTFARCQDLLRQPPQQAETRADLRAKLNVQSGGVVFATIQKFLPDNKGDRHPLLSDRRNIVVIADEAHRSQYDFIDGLARHLHDALPNASFVGFTGTPIEREDANTRAVFGDYISIYDIQRSVSDEATVPIYYESRLAKLALDEDERPDIDPDFEEATEGEEVERKERLKTKWAQLEAIVGSEKRIRLVAQDIVDHFEQRLEVLEGKAMIVCMSRRICVELYGELVQLRPDWHDDGDDKGTIKVVMIGSASDPLDWQPHIRNKPRREALANRFRDANDPLQVVLVRDMWLTGFDAPSLHTMYVDKPMRGHGLMQAIARQSGVQGQTGRPRGRLPRPGSRAQAGARHVHRERRARQDDNRSRRSCGGAAGEVRGLSRSLPRLRLVPMDKRHAV
jgi:type I restriction enzyme R subunit